MVGWVVMWMVVDGSWIFLLKKSCGWLLDGFLDGCGWGLDGCWMVIRMVIGWFVGWLCGWLLDGCLDGYQFSSFFTRKSEDGYWMVWMVIWMVMGWLLDGYLDGKWMVFLDGYVDG